MGLQENIKYKPSNFKAILFLLSPLIFCALGCVLSIGSYGIVSFMFGQLFLAVFFFQCFILLHECGHLSYFKNRNLNKLFGHCFAFLSFIPLSSWISIHNLHHKWTGFRDKDPTTEGTVNPKFGAATKLLVNVSWFLFLPLFTIGYRLGNYWNINKMKRHLQPRKMPTIYINMILQLILYGVLFYFAFWWLLSYILPAYFVSLMISDLFILSQHSHIKIPLANDENVKPIRFSEQLKYTRSIRLINGLGKFVYFNFNLHELHHEHPSLPAYYLHKVNTKTPNYVGFWSYLKDAKQMKGIDFIFNSSDRKIGKSNQ